MNSLFNPDHHAATIARINQITPESKALWGKMNSAQMLAHLQVPLKLSVGELQIKRGLIGFLFGKMAKKKLTSGEPMSKNLPTFKEAKISDARDLEKERAILIGYVNRMAQAGPEGMPKNQHPFFGVMTPQEWDLLQCVHLDHHLRQFGV